MNKKQYNFCEEIVLRSSRYFIESGQKGKEETKSWWVGFAVVR